ncbi:MAG: ATP-dependent Clp protease adaptor ClpS [Desulfatitalea sp.]
MSTSQPGVITSVQERAQTRTQRPPMYQVLLHNDDFTTKEFVVQILVAVFHKLLPEATQLMWQVHRHGKGVAGVFTREIAETKVAAVTTLAREAQFPLKVTMEPEP